MRELTQNYGELAYFWFDHHDAKSRDSSGRVVWDTIDDIVRKNQPTCAMLGPDCWLTGAETGFSTYPMWHGVDTTGNTTHGRPVIADATHGNPHGTWFKVWESVSVPFDVCPEPVSACKRSVFMRSTQIHGAYFSQDCSNYNGCHPWFFGGDSPQPLPLMMTHWESTYGLGHNYILSLPPSPDGIITPKMAASAAAFGQERHRRYGHGSSGPDTPSECELGRTGGRLAQWRGATAEDADGASAASQTELVLELPVQQTRFDRVFLSEDVLHDGQLVANYTVDACSAATRSACDTPGKQWTTLVNGSSAKGGQTIGTHHIDIVNNATARFVRLRLLNVLGAGAVLPLVSFRVLKVEVPPPVVAGYVPEPGLCGGQVQQGCPRPQIVTCKSIAGCVAEMAALCSAASNCSSFGVVEGTTYAQPYGECGTSKAYLDKGWNLWRKANDGEVVESTSKP